jgi:hypothetical protein
MARRIVVVGASALSQRAERYEQQAIESEQHVSVLREVLLGRDGGKQRE